MCHLNSACYLKNVCFSHANEHMLILYVGCKKYPTNRFVGYFCSILKQKRKNLNANYLLIMMES
jgi:hypothetical protein